MKVSDNFYRLLEIEFYYNDSKEHNDTYTQGHKGKKDQAIDTYSSGINITIVNNEASGCNFFYLIAALAAV